MPRKSKRTKGPSVTLWVVVDTATGLPIMALNKPLDEKDLLEGEAVYEYRIKEEKRKTNQ